MTLLKNSFLFPVLLLVCNCLCGQDTDSLKYKYTNQTIYRYGSYFMKGTERIGFQQLQKEFDISDLGTAHYMRAKKYKTISTIFKFVSLATGITGLILISDRNLTRSRQNMAYGFFAGQLISSIGAGRYTELSGQSLDKALWQRNKDLLFPAR